MDARNAADFLKEVERLTQNTDDINVTDVENIFKVKKTIPYSL